MIFGSRESDILLKANTQKRPKETLYSLGFLIFMKDVICQKCGSANDYHIIPKAFNHTAYCNLCNSYIKNLPQDKPLTLPFGKYKGTLLTDMVTNEQIKYLQWIITQDFGNNIKGKIQAYLNTI
jgi:uncharacterized protein (DUF3820 family)